eukprot:TRINITY_DN44849_c0_g1_i2.p3 TRINITY_DN44849_c0_g1~~TRINITY_DN44849_c0_g1_i2.p3  ORF type:complete len:200 (+),score=-2.31 TRINITY_DN44849_c0_g1_i2:241-840(+)
MKKRKLGTTPTLGKMKVRNGEYLRNNCGIQRNAAQLRCMVEQMHKRGRIRGGKKHLGLNMKLGVFCSEYKMKHILICTYNSQNVRACTHCVLCCLNVVNNTRQCYSVWRIFLINKFVMDLKERMYQQGLLQPITPKLIGYDQSYFVLPEHQVLVYQMLVVIIEYVRVWQNLFWSVDWMHFCVGQCLFLQFLSKEQVYNH